MRVQTLDTNKHTVDARGKSQRADAVGVVMSRWRAWELVQELLGHLQHDEREAFVVHLFGELREGED